MKGQLYILFSFFITGVCIGLLFDFFRITRKSFKTPNILTYLEDALFWILSGALVLATIFLFTDGQIRLYMILTMIIGATLYFATISKYFIKINTKIIQFIKNIIHMILSPFIKIFKAIHKF